VLFRSLLIELDRQISRIRLSVRIPAIIFENFGPSQEPQAMRWLGPTANGRKGHAEGPEETRFLVILRARLDCWRESLRTVQFIRLVSTVST